MALRVFVSMHADDDNERSKFDVCESDIHCMHAGDVDEPHLRSPVSSSSRFILLVEGNLLMNFVALILTAS